MSIKLNKKSLFGKLTLAACGLLATTSSAIAVNCRCEALVFYYCVDVLVSSGVEQYQVSNASDCKDWVNESAITENAVCQPTGWPAPATVGLMEAYMISCWEE